MATPTFTHDLTTISTAETTTGWVAVGGAMLSLDPDTKIQGSNSLGVPSSANTLVGAVFNIGSTIDLFDKHLFIWLNTGVSEGLANFAAGGVRVRVAGPTATNFGEWYVGGRDVAWCGKGWRLIVIDCNRPFDATGGTPPVISGAAGATIQHVGATALATITLMFGFIINIDIMRYGTKFGVSGGSDGDPVTLQNIFDHDFVTDPTNNVFGLVTKNRAGTFEINGELRLGIESGAGNTVFSSRNELVIFQDQPCSLTYLKMKAQQGSGTTKIKIGSGVGSGDSKVGINGSIFDRINSVHGREYFLDFGASVNLVEMFGSTVLRAKEVCLFPDAIGHELISNQFISCGQVDVNQIKARKCIVSGHGLLDSGDITANVAADPVDSGSITINVTAGTRTYSRTTGSFVTDGFTAGMYVSISGFTNAVNNGVKVIQSVAALDIVVAPSQTLVTETGGGDERIRVLFGYTRSTGSFLTDGFLAGQSIITSGFTNAGNNTTSIIATVSATLITVTLTTGFVAESGGGNERFKSSGNSADGALLWNEDIDVQDTSFLGNTSTSGIAAAIQHPGAVGSPYTYDALLFAGNDFDINNTSGSTITINATNGSNPATSKGNTVIINNAVNMNVTCLNESGLTVSGVRVRIENDPAETLITNGTTGANGIFSDSFNYIGDTDVKVIARLKGFKNASAFSVITTAGLDVPFTMIKDPAVDLP